MSRIAVFYHCKISGKGIPDTSKAIAIVKEQMDHLKNSKLAEEAQEIHIGINGSQADLKAIAPFLPNKAQVHVHGSDSRWEFATLALVRKLAISDASAYILYHHSKGVTSPNDKHKQWHRRAMQEMLVQNWHRCIRDLERGFELCGRHWEPDLRLPQGAGVKFFVGNFWWTTGRWVRKLAALPQRGDASTNRLRCEWWVGSVPWKPIIMDYAYPERSDQFVSSGAVRPLNVGDPMVKPRKEVIQNTPIFILAKDRCSCLKAMIGRLENDGLKNLFIIDTGSTYPPMVEFLEKVKYPIIRCEPLASHAPKYVLWDLKVVCQANQEGKPFVYTDCDTIPDHDCPEDWLEHLYNMLAKYKGFEKAGMGLKLSDIPACYAHREQVMKHEARFYLDRLEPHVFESMIDTTMALYRPGTPHTLHSIRTGGQYLCRHIPWYYDSNNLPEEERHYIANLHPKASMWTRQDKHQ